MPAASESHGSSQGVRIYQYRDSRGRIRADGESAFAEPHYADRLLRPDPRVESGTVRLTLPLPEGIHADFDVRVVDRSHAKIRLIRLGP